MAGKKYWHKRNERGHWLTIDQDDLLIDNALQMVFDEMQKDEDTKIYGKIT